MHPDALIAYDSQFGNTKRITRAIAELLGSAQLIRAEEAGALEKFRVIPFFCRQRTTVKSFLKGFCFARQSLFYPTNHIPCCDAIGIALPAT